LKLNCKTYELEIKETTELEEETKNEILSGKWPGAEFETSYATWKEKFAADKSAAESTCVLQ
jgi:hypothetical protein